jgi:hypothetical protein
VAGAAAAGWVAASQIKSPAQVAAEAEPPDPSLITVPVERTVIANDLVVRGTVRFENPEPVLSGGLVLPGVDAVVTMIAQEGDTLDEGDVLYELAGRPTFVLQGDLPLFRTAEHRDEGEDIAQFQEAMTRLGFFDTDIDGEYGTVTQRAMRDFYESKGYEPWRPQGQSRYPLVQSEFVFFETLPIRVDSTSVGRGDVADGEVMAVSGARLVIDSALDLDEDDLVAVGDRVMIDHQGLGIEMTGTISAKASTPGTNELPPDQIYLEITPDEVRSELSGVNVRIVIPVEARSTEGEVLAVPAAALSATGSGDTIVTVMEDDESTRTVVVEPGLATAAGLVEVTPVEGELDESDWVVVGVERAE